MKLPKTKKLKIPKKKAIDALWSELIRNKDNNTCLMCSKQRKDGWVMNAHHVISRKAQGTHARYDLRNGICLCYNCHINKLHGEQGDFEFIQKYTALVNSLYPDELKDSIKRDATKVIKPIQLLDIYQDFKDKLNG